METSTDHTRLGPLFGGVDIFVDSTQRETPRVNLTRVNLGPPGVMGYLEGIAHLNQILGWKGVVDNLKAEEEGRSQLESFRVGAIYFQDNLLYSVREGRLDTSTWKSAVVDFVRKSVDIKDVLENQQVGIATIACIAYALQAIRDYTLAVCCYGGDEEYLGRVDMFLECMSMEASVVSEWINSEDVDPYEVAHILRLYYDAWKISYRTKFHRFCEYDNRHYFEERRGEGEVGYSNAVYLGSGSVFENQLYDARVRRSVNAQNALKTIVSPGPGSGKSSLIRRQARMYETLNISVWADEGYGDDAEIVLLEQEREIWAGIIQIYEEGLPGLSRAECEVYAKRAFRRYMELRIVKTRSLYQRFLEQLDPSMQGKHIGFIDIGGVAYVGSIAARQFINEELERPEYEDLKRALRNDEEIRIPKELAYRIRAFLFRYFDSSSFELLNFSGNKILVLDLPTAELEKRVVRSGERIERRSRHFRDAEALRLFNLVFSAAFPDITAVIQGSYFDTYAGKVRYKTELQAVCSAVVEEGLLETRERLKYEIHSAREIMLGLVDTRIKVAALRAMT